jgi:uncharacterized protein YbaR (Trm112 family)
MTSSPLSPAFIALLRCPLTRQQLTLASAEEVAQINHCLEKPLDAALIRADGLMTYPLHHGIPSLLPTDGIVFTSL